MLQQMSSPADAQLGEVSTVVRAFDGRIRGDVSSGASSDTAEDFELPSCRIRRNYSCTKCKFYTQNPRAYLVHTRDAHFVKLKIFECPYCIYASRHHQKLLRHVKMVHDDILMHTAHKNEADISKHNGSNTVEDETEENQSKMEDMLEEIEDTEDMHLDIEEDNEDKSDYYEMEVDPDRISEHSLAKGKDNMFSCTKCNYATHLRARFTKHVKYHSMPMIKCIVCDFRTPYKWNLDRHMKNHGGLGHFKCTVCNFTADIRQSLTVHEMNHHTPPAGQWPHGSRRRNRVGATDTGEAEPAAAKLVKEEEGSGDSRSSHSASEMGVQNMEKDIVACNSDSNEASETAPKNLPMNENSLHSPGNTDEAKKNKKPARPIPQLIPLNSSTPNQAKTEEPPAKKFRPSNIEAFDATDSNDNTETQFSNTSKDTDSRKKNESFFDKLKKRLLTETGEEGSLICKNCGFESKCLSEHSVHEKTCIPLASRSMTNTLLPSMSSTRCQNCRHRCKSSADLYIHLQSCGKGDRAFTEVEDSKTSNEAPIANHDKDPHPMENVVFVWNNINNETNKFETPLDININDDSTMPEVNKSFEIELVDDNDSMNLSPSQAAGKNVFKCPHCPFWASTASRFHVHIVGHLNKKPFECSLCKYKSNWRWDITKHIKLKSARDPEHNNAKVLMTDETGRRNYSKYTKFLAIPVQNENGENEFRYIDPNTEVDDTMEVEEPCNELHDFIGASFEVQPLNLQTPHFDPKNESTPDGQDKKVKKTLWKCKKCNYRDPSKTALLEHVREHAKAEGGAEETKANKKPEATLDPADLAYRCGHCHQLSNWKHVIQRHCRLKHNGIVKVVTVMKPKPDPAIIHGALTVDDITNEFCTKCPFRSSDKETLLQHLQQHQPSAHSIFKCYFCTYFVKNETELMQHLHIHGVDDPEDFIAKAMRSKSPPIDVHTSLASQNVHPTPSTKRHKCTECPYETNSKSQYMYHEQFHRLPADTPYKCPECNYSVSKRHLLHQHLRVHGILPRKLESEADLESMAKSDDAGESSYIEEAPFVWVSAKNEFHKMYKCRYCSYVNSQKCKLPNHEKIHCLVFDNDVTIYKCLECKFTFDNAGKLSDHSKTHAEIYGRIYCPVEDDIPDEEQIAKLRKVVELEKSDNAEHPPRDGELCDTKDIKTLYFCHKCPARYFTDSELQVHDECHNSSSPHKCLNCDFAVVDENDLTLHSVIHSDEYNTKTKMLKFIHKPHPAHRPPYLESVRASSDSPEIWIVNQNKKPIPETILRKTHETKPMPKQYNCRDCPAKFFKSSALNYHMGLHGGEGDFKCKKCTYTVKNIGNLAKHELLHEPKNKANNDDYDSGEDGDYKNIPLSGTDLFQRKTEAQKRVLTDKDKLVKPNDHFPPVLQADPQFGYLMHGNPEFIYPTYLKNGRQKEKRYKCHKCPSAFEKREQYKIHLSLHGSKQRYKCELCDYSVKYYANYVQHMRKHQMNDEAQAERKKGISGFTETENQAENKEEDTTETTKLAIKTMPKAAPKTDFQQFSLRDQQTLRLLQRRRSLANLEKETGITDTTPTKERKWHMCLLCPYTNQRQDALNNHYKRHGEADVLNASSHKCSYCNFVVAQTHFLREHLKTHFNYHKTVTPECFVANENVSFTVTKIEEECESIDLKLDMIKNTTKCNDDKTFIKIKTGELVVE